MKVAFGIPGDSEGFLAVVRGVRGLVFSDVALLERATRLLNAGQPPQPSAPPAPLQLPPPGHVPGACSGARKGRDGCCAGCGLSETAPGDLLLRAC